MTLYLNIHMSNGLIYHLQFMLKDSDNSNNSDNSDNSDNSNIFLIKTNEKNSDFMEVSDTFHIPVNGEFKTYNDIQNFFGNCSTDQMKKILNLINTCDIDRIYFNDNNVNNVNIPEGSSLPELDITSATTIDIYEPSVGILPIYLVAPTLTAVFTTIINIVTRFIVAGKIDKRVVVIPVISTLVSIVVYLFQILDKGNGSDLGATFNALFAGSGIGFLLSFLSSIRYYKRN